MISIRVEGIEYPLETFIDSHRYIRTGGEVPDFAGNPGFLDVVTAGGEVRLQLEALTIAWHEVAAVHAPEGSLHFALCDECGEAIAPVNWHMETRANGPVMVVETPYCTDCRVMLEMGEFFQ